MNLLAALPWLLPVGLPLLLALALLRRHWRPAVLVLMPWAPLPALALALLEQPGRLVDLPWLMLGMRLGFDVTASLFLGFTALLWLLAGIYARYSMAQDESLYRFVAFYLVTLSGNIGLILAQDMLSFFLFFAVMSFASYGLIIHHHHPATMWAGQVYITLVVLSEVLLFAAMALAATGAEQWYFPDVTRAIAQSPCRDLIIAFSLAGFGIKAGMLPLHVSLPLIYPAAPIPAAAVLSGAMVKAGLLGWLRLLPLGGPALPGWGTYCIVAGLAAAFYGVVVGVTQKQPRTVLAYSSISQMGLITVIIGLGLLMPGAWPMLLPVLLVYALHHAFAKGALFLGVGVAERAPERRWQRCLLTVGLLLPAVALAGAPLTTGAVAKVLLKTATATAPSPWPDILGKLLSLAAVGTTLLMGRFLFQTWPSAPARRRLEVGMWLPWAVAASGLPVMVLLVPPALFFEAMQLSLAPAALWSTLWPPGVGAVVVGGIWGLHHRSGIRLRLHIPAGDVLVPVSWLTGRLWRGWRIIAHALITAWSTLEVTRWRFMRGEGLLRAHLAWLEEWCGRWRTAGMLFLLLTTLFIALLMRP